MRTRSAYRFLLRLHPPCFRKQYEDQMLWIYDESVRSRGAVSLLFDALVSLLRQWILRSGYWRRAKPTMKVDGAFAMAEQLRQNAQNLHRRVWRFNLVWLVCAFIVLLLSRNQMFWSPFVLPAIANSIVGYLRNRQGLRPGERANEYVTLSLSCNPEDLRKLYRQQIEAKRDGLIAWCQFKPSKISIGEGRFVGGRFLLVVLVVVGVWMLLKPIHPGASYDWKALSEFLAGLIVLAVSWHFLRKLNEQSAQAFQQEIDAMVEPMAESMVESSQPPSL